MPSSPPGNSLRKPGLESLFERERKNTLLCLYLCVYAFGTCASLPVSDCFFFGGYFFWLSV